MTTEEKKEQLFRPIGQVVDTAAGEEDEGSTVDEIDSLCMKCHEQGKTRLLLTSIPYFREVVVMSFRCEHCGFSNNEIQSAGEIRENGTLYTAKILDRADLDRQIVRSSTCEITIPELDLTLPPTERGQLTTIEGLIRDIVGDLSLDQPLRKIQAPRSMKAILGDPDEDDEDAEKKAALPASVRDAPLKPFTLKLDDPSGNSFIEFIGSMSDPKWHLRTYPRTFEQNVQLGLDAAKQEAPSGEISKEEVCGHGLQTLMKRVDIPYFKEILIMSTNCEHCGYRDNEIHLTVEDQEDMSRDILKSETAGLEIPEIDLVLTSGTLGGRFTTVEGILNQIYEELSEKALVGDSANPEDRMSFEKFLANLKSVINVEKPFTIILDDPLANSYIQSLYAPDPDPNMKTEFYDRTFDQNEELGLNDIQVEGYEGDPNVPQEGAEGDAKATEGPTS
ncbi:zinc-finger protein zpr1 [Coprinopsis sp. MPI-PUGE-AT-0042]|nr:zinc-finger protein zpr1 [Coprinopsis sp. MPI-PUGE-AT-0042]